MNSKTSSDQRPVIIGVGQSVSHWDGKDIDTAPSPQSLAADALGRALEDSSLKSPQISTAVFVRLFEDSVPNVKPAIGEKGNIVADVLKRSGLTSNRYIYSEFGGEQPQALVNHFAKRLVAGEETCVLLMGAEAIAAAKMARRNKVDLDWSGNETDQLEDWSQKERLLTGYELANGLGTPPQTYAAIEHALRRRLGHTRQEHVKLISKLWERFSEVAASHPFAQFPEKRTASFLAEASPENRPVSDPYLRWHIAQDSVNQGAAVIMTTEAQALENRVNPSNLVYLHGHATLNEKPVSLRKDLSKSPALEQVLEITLQRSKLDVSDISFFDIYSCFPCVVLMAAEALGVDAFKTDLTVTGGLPFFGGAGNNYSMHAIATMVERLREKPGSNGLVLANGGFLSKQSAGVYSTIPPEIWSAADDNGLQAELDAVDNPKLVKESGSGEIEAYSVVQGKFGPTHAFAIARTDDNRRVIAKLPNGHRSLMRNWLKDDEPLGKKVHFEHVNGRNLIQPEDTIESLNPAVWLGREFEFMDVAVDGHVLEVTINRPEARNALHSAAHYELGEIWDEFERRDDLWVAILTGAGDQAFSAGNDLKATARGGDQSWPASGFGGLTHRFDREKPIIAAVNGTAMGGGLEIVLACDLAIAIETAKLALPEVKVGLFAAAGGVQRLTTQIGRKAAMEMILTGRIIEGRKAAELGLVNQVVEQDALGAARRLAAEIVSASPTSIRASKRVLNTFDKADDLEDALKSNRPVLDWLLKTEDFQSGITAFAEKRKPEWKNR